MYLSRSNLITLSIALVIALVSGCAYIGPDSYDPATFDSRDYYTMDHEEADDSVLGVSGLTIGFGSSWPVFGTLSPYSSNYTLDQARYSYCPVFSNNPIPPVITGFVQPGRAIPPVSMSPELRPYHFSGDRRLYEDRRAARISRSTPRATPTATRPQTSLSRPHSSRGGSSGGHMPRASRDGRRAIQ